ncbi:hypothetical protein WOLCODRAFT_135510 [Wolfiporia cocos MD-104 SS10]|uniref:Uncharacterized protein n=1 Tax=Wolfiporia cocos (strain MD-104) TaxID=742152 RepID=A0A2H3JBR6_WOLCO|nr:hypothetical protein WOLCODRAFT_135510 [Wolfiporia cocos MD-104 SS10]
MASSLSQLSACVTRILSLTGFPKELKTRDIQAAFSEWENASGGFKIKWIDDTSLLIVFNDATVAKRAYLHTLAFPPVIFSSPNSTQTTTIKPYDGPDAQAVIQSVNARQHNGNGRGHNVRNSVSHGRGMSVSNPHRNGANNSANGADRANNGSPRDRDREPSPTLPNIPSHPTLNSLISSTLGADASPVDPTVVDPAIVAALPDHGAPRIGDPGKRIIGAALGVRHPGLGPRMVNGAGNGMAEVQRAMSGLVVAE